MLMWFGAQLAHKKSWMVSVIYDYNNNYVFLAMINQLFALITKEKLRQTVSQGKIINVLVVLWGILIDYCDFALKNIVWFFCQFFQWIYQILRFQTSQSSSRHIPADFQANLSWHQLKCTVVIRYLRTKYASGYRKFKFDQL